MGISNMIRGFANGESISYLKDGVLHKGALMHLMVGSEDDLANLPEDIMPGSVAYTAGYASVWQKTADSTWEPSSAGVNLAGIDPGKEVAYVKNGVLLKGTMEKIMVDDQSDLASLPEGIGPGSIAFTAGYASAWQKAANDTWGEVTQEGGGGGMKLLTLTITETSATLNATYAEVKAAMQAGTLVGYLMTIDRATGLALATAYEDAHDPTHGDPYTMYFAALDDGGTQMTLIADTEDGQLYATNGG